MEVHEFELKQNRRVVLSIFFLLTLVVVASAVYYYYSLRDDLLSQGGVEVKITAEQKAHLLRGWIDERKAEGAYLAKNPLLLNSITNKGVRLGESDKITLTGIFEELRRNHDYTSIAFLSNSGEELILSGEPVPAETGKRYAKKISSSPETGVLLEGLGTSSTSIEILTPFPVNSRVTWGYVYQIINVREPLTSLLREGESPLSDGRTRLFYFHSDTLYSVLDSIPPYSRSSGYDPETIPVQLHGLALRNRSGAVYGTGFDKEKKIGYFEKLGSFPVSIYYTHRLENVEKPLLSVGVLLTIIIFITITASGLAVSLTFSRQQAAFAGRLAESEAFLESIREGMSDGFILFGYDARFIALNSKAASVIRKTREEIIGKPVSEVLVNVENSGFWSTFNQVVTSRKPVTSIDYYPEWDTYFHNKMFPVKDGIAVFFSDITKETKLKHDLKEANQQLEALTLHLQVATENEREAIAREIHDELGQVLTSLKMDLAIMKNSLKAEEKPFDKDVLINDMVTMGQRIDAVAKRLRRIITELRPEVLDHLGFVPAVEWLIEESASRSGIKFEIVKNFESVELGKHPATALFRIIQEACTNIIRHSEASRAVITLSNEDQSLKVTIKDNGKGFSTDGSWNTRSFGLIGMKERAKLVKAQLEVTSSEGEGTLISLVIPKKEGIRFV